MRVEGYRGDAYAWKDTGATPTRGRIQGRRLYAWKDTGTTSTRGRIQGLRVRVEGYRGNVYAWKDTWATCTRGRTQTGGATLARGREEPIRTKGHTFW